jgi:hypothetical protein
MILLGGRAAIGAPTGCYFALPDLGSVLDNAGVVRGK